MIAKDKILDIIERLETEGIEGVWAKFAEPPHVVVYESVVGYVVMLWRDGVYIKIELDDDWRIRKAYVLQG
ncbi:MAG: hypothetical protein RXR02_07215 [Thermoproteus sp.]